MTANTLEPILIAADIHVRFGGVQALNGATLHVDSGAITGVIGPNGSGKSTLFNVITGLTRADRGAVVFGGRDITTLAPHQISRTGIGRTFQLVRLFDRMTSLENLVVVSRDEPEAARARAEELLDSVSLLALRHEYAGNLSYGQRKLVEFARLMMNDPRLVMLDEPFAGVNPTMEKRLLEQLQRWISDGRTIVVTDHEMKIMMEICEAIYVLDHGEVIAQGTPATVQNDPLVMEAYFGR